MEFKVKITSQTGEEILLGHKQSDKNTIKQIDIVFDTIDENVYRKGDGSLLHLTILGDIKYDDGDSTTSEHIKLFNWAKSEKTDELYRTVEIGVFNNDTRLRAYVFEKMFVEDYAEKFYSSSKRNTDKISGFELKLTQMENNFDKAVSMN